MSNVKNHIAIFKCIEEGGQLYFKKTANSKVLVKENNFRHQDGTEVRLDFKEYLISSSGNTLYPIVDGIIYALPELILKRDKITEQVNRSRFKKSIQDFYNSKGWSKDKDSEVYEDARRYEDLRDVSEEYISRSRTKIGDYINERGRYLLDAASGPIQFDEYLAYSRNFNQRICVDISIQALKEAREKGLNKEIYILGDICNLPIRNDKIDSVISLNTIYHIPKDKQLKAIQELNRVLMPKGKAVIVYSWGRNAWLMRAATLPRVVAKKIKKLGELIFNRSDRVVIEPDIYFYAHKRSFFNERNLGFKVDIHSWRLLSVPFMKYYIHDWLGGKYLLQKVRLIEDRFPNFSGKLSEYPMIFFTKP